MMIRPDHRWTYPAAVEHVVDGDTVDLVIDQGFKEYKRIRVRIHGIDTPERGEDGYHAAKNYVLKWFIQDSDISWFGHELEFPLLFESIDGKLDNFGRYLGRIWGVKGTELGQCLLDEGLAKEYD